MARIVVSILLGAGMCLLIVAAPAIAEDWQQFQYDLANTGNSTADAPDTNHTIWITDDIGAVEGSQAIIAGGRVFVYADTQVHALDKDTGTISWSTAIPGDTSGYGSWASPTYSDGKLFLSSGYNLSRIRASDGTVEQMITFPDGGHSCNGGPTVASGLVFAGSGYEGTPVSHYYAFDASDLTDVVWNFSIGSGECACSTPAVAGDGIVFGNGSSLTRVNKTNGVLDWTTDLSSGTILGSAAIDTVNCRVYVATASGNLALLHALNFTDGSPIWTSYTVIKFTDGTPAILDVDHIYISGNAFGSPGHTYCFNSTGIEQWRVSSGSWVMSPAVADGKLYTGNCEDMGGWGTFEGIGAYDVLTGAPIWSYAYAGSSPSVASGMVVSIGKGGKVYAFGPAIPSTTFMISGWVFEANSTPCNNPNVQITNTATSESWAAITRSESNYYQLVLASDTDLNVNDVLKVEVTSQDSSQSKIVECRVTENEVADGGRFGYNVTLAVPNQQTWYFSNDEASAPIYTGADYNKTMTKGVESGDDRITLEPGQKVWFYTNHVAECNVSFPEGVWNVSYWVKTLDATESNTHLYTRLQVIKHDESPTEILEGGNTISYSANIQENAESLEAGSFSIPKDGRFAIEVFWSESAMGNLEIYCNPPEKHSSQMTSPSSDPGYPIPELSTIILLGVGLLLIVGYVGLSGRAGGERT